MSGMKRLTLSLPLFGILAMLAASTASAQPRPPAPVAPETSGQASTPPPQGTSRGENFSANKTPAQLFQSDCTGAGCHKGPGGLAKNSSSLGLAGFLREHYTNSRESAAALAAYLMGAGAGPAEAARPAREPRQPRAATRAPAAGEEAKPEEGQGPLTPARPRRQAAPAAAATPGAAGTPAGEASGDIVRPEQGQAAKPAPAAAQRNQRGQRQHTTAAPTPAPEAAPAPPPPPPPPPAVHDIFD